MKQLKMRQLRATEILLRTVRMTVGPWEIYVNLELMAYALETLIQGRSRN
jgi:hypothetical protein